MKKILMLIHDGFEEIEALTPVDLCRRAGVEVCVCSMTGNRTIHGAHGIDVYADAVFQMLATALASICAEVGNKSRGKCEVG